MPDRSYLGWPFFEDGHRELARKLDAWARENIRPLPEAHEDTVDDLCRKLVALLGEAGWLEYAASEKLDVRSLCLLRETLGYHHALADFAFAMQGLGSGAISLFGSKELKERYLPGVREGKKIAAFALSEPEAGSDVAAVSTTATEDEDHYVIDGTKTWISNGGLADFYTVFARTGEAPGAKGLSAFVVDAGTPGFEVAERIPVMAPHPLAKLKFENVRVPKDRMIGEPGQGFRIAMATLDVFRSTVGAAALGFARRALDEALKRATNRELFGAPMSELQLVQGKLADMALGVDASALLVYRAAWTKDRIADRVTREAAMAKLHATETAQRVIDEAVQIFGGLGVTSGHPVERLYREIRALRIYEGASEVQKVIIARQVIKQSGESAEPTV
ncbi:acyl-CoA dehydrogenase-like protein [Rubrobacter xylanophilus DSM 9941]|uniref:Acyl-CoA dehydrogenase-like protein n=1 Tax=Rubrobacter xylanophilus (strain DSM 9941 / JCM 11954 / NBRC 16129 / PRD-1) TaxID=266117 RepID=Q1ATS0_RUBXD|nr:acyl-CoA dehydrogenase family protein [Rubrobacter xylanophilus]ABG05208.1 acyl-CoA dehydrogenase-like protein [Rubrobacter xylanophilus DSM 9941]